MQTESSESNGYEQPAASAPAPAEDRSWTVKINFRSWSLHYACSMFSSASSSNCSSNEVFRLDKPQGNPKVCQDCLSQPCPPCHFMRGAVYRLRKNYHPHFRQKP